MNARRFIVEGKRPLVMIARAAAGWEGDRYAVYEKDGNALALVSTIWDSRKDAEEFVVAYRSSISLRYPSVTTG